MSAEKVCVVGSGPAGATAAYFLWQAGFDVTILDGGLGPEPEVTTDIADWLKSQDDEKLVSAATSRAGSSRLPYMSQQTKYLGRCAISPLISLR